MEVLKSCNLEKNPLEFSNILMKLEIAYLRRKLELANQINVSKEKLAI